MFYPPLKMNAKRALGVGLIWLALIGNGKGQGFVNLDFEQAADASRTIWVSLRRSGIGISGMDDGI